MNEPALDRLQTWQDFHDDRSRAIDEINCAMPSAEPWEVDQYKAELTRLYYELDYAEREMQRIPDDGVMPWE